MSELKQSPKASFVVPVFNAGAYLPEALASLQWQTEQAWEAICVNDGSSDSSASILESFAQHDARFKVIHQENQGIVSALNRGIEAAQCPLIARMDSDDVAIPERLSMQLRFMDSNLDVAAVGGQILIVDPEGEPLSVGRYETDSSKIESLLLNGRAGSLCHPAVLMRRDSVLKAGGYRKRFEWVEDTDLWLRIVRSSKIANLHCNVLHYRVHDQSVCWQKRGQQKQLLHQLLSEAHRERGLSIPSFQAAPAKLRRRSSAHSKWARQAARAGFYRSSLKYLRNQLQAEPFSLLTLRTIVEAAIRAGISVVARKEKESSATTARLAPHSPEQLTTSAASRLIALWESTNLHR